MPAFCSTDHDDDNGDDDDEDDDDDHDDDHDGDDDEHDNEVFLIGHNIAIIIIKIHTIKIIINQCGHSDHRDHHNHRRHDVNEALLIANIIMMKINVVIKISVVMISGLDIQGEFS